MKESILQTKLIKWLESHDCYILKVVVCNKLGFPDLVIFKNGKVILFECKATGKKPTKIQALVHKKLKDYGIIVLWADSLEKSKGLLARFLN